MKVLSLFDGMACAQIALRQLMLLNGFENLRVDTYYASEIDKYAIAQTQHNFPDTVHLGDVERWREWDIDWEHLDLVMGGSPCQGFSFAGQQLAFDDPRSRLFFVFAEILDYARRLTPTECARLQTVPEWYEWNCSETQQYRMLGNGWTVEVIKHILSYGEWN